MLDARSSTQAFAASLTSDTLDFRSIAAPYGDPVGERSGNRRSGPRRRWTRHASRDRLPGGVSAPRDSWRSASGLRARQHAALLEPALAAPDVLERGAARGRR